MFMFIWILQDFELFDYITKKVKDSFQEVWADAKILMKCTIEES